MVNTPKKIEYVESYSQVLDASKKTWEDLFWEKETITELTVFGDFGVYLVVPYKLRYELIQVNFYDFDDSDWEVNFSILLHPDVCFFIGKQLKVPFQSISINGTIYYEEDKQYIDWDISFYLNYNSGYELGIKGVK